MDALVILSHALGLVGVAVVTYGVVLGLVRFIAAETESLRGKDAAPAQNRLRNLLGYYLLLGLEFLIAADIVRSIVSPSLEELLNLGAIVAIRTVISFSLNWELAQHAKREREQL